jgi:hypothetical protein
MSVSQSVSMVEIFYLFIYLPMLSSSGKGRSRSELEAGANFLSHSLETTYFNLRNLKQAK